MIYLWGKDKEHMWTNIGKVFFFNECKSSFDSIHVCFDLSDVNSFPWFFIWLYWWSLQSDTRWERHRFHSNQWASLRPNHHLPRHPRTLSSPAQRQSRPPAPQPMSRLRCLPQMPACRQAPTRPCRKPQRWMAQLWWSTPLRWSWTLQPWWWTLRQLPWPALPARPQDTQRRRQKQWSWWEGWKCWRERCTA